MEINYLKAIDKYLDGVEAGVRSIFPIESNRRILELEAIDVNRDAAKESAQNLKAQVDATLNDGSVTVPVYGTLVLKDKETGKVIDRVKRRILDAPVMTKRSTFVVNGADYSTMKQFRLKPGIYTRVKENGDLESFFNMSKGGKVKLGIKLNPENNSFNITLGTTNPKLYPILKALGVKDASMAKAWGDRLFEANKTDEKNYLKDLRKAYKAIAGRDAVPNADEAIMVKEIKAFFENTGMSPDTTKITLGQGFESVTPEALMVTSSKLLRVSKGEEKPDARDSLYFKEIFDVDELMKARLKAFKFEISKKVRNNLDKKTKIADIFSKDMLNKPVNSFITQSGLSSTSEAVNPVSFINAATKTTIMGEGGLGSLDAVTTAMRSVDPSHAGFLDPIHTPESDKIGINLHLATGAEIHGRDVKTAVYNLKTKKLERKTAGELMEAKVAFTDQYDFKNNKWNYPTIRVMHMSEIDQVKPSEVDYVMPNSKAMFSVSSNLVPFLANTQGNRAMMGNKMFGQAVSLVNREEPLVKVKFGDEAYENRIRDTYAVKSMVDGTVSNVDKDQITVKDKAGKQHKFGLYNYFPLASKSFLHNTPRVKVGDKVTKGTLLADDNFSKDKSLALGTNLNVAYLPYKDKTFEDGIPISESAAKKLTSSHLYEFKESVGESDLHSISAYKKQFPGIITQAMESKLDSDGVIKEGQIVEPGDILAPILRYREPTAEDQALGKLSKMLMTNYRDASLRWDNDYTGEVVRVVKNGKNIIVHIKAEREARIGDKLAGRYGNKGVITAVIPDDEMPRTKDGRTVDMMISPLSVPGRINPSQILETTAGKIAQKRGRPLKIDNFNPNYKSDVEIARLASKHGVNTEEALYDPKTGRKLATASMGPEYILKLMYTVDKKLTGRGPRASYNSDLQPTKGGMNSAKAMDRLTWTSLVAHGARENLREMSTYKAEKNPELWNAVRLGLPLPAPKTPFVVDKMFNMMAAGGINVKKEGNQMQLTPMTDNETLNRSNGEIDDAQVIMAKNLRPVKDGLFDDQKTGGLAGSKWTHVRLAEPIVSPVMEKPVKTLLELNSKQYDGLIKGTLGYNTKTKQLTEEIDEKDVLIGGKAFKAMLDKININKELSSLRGQALTAKNAGLDVINKKMRYLSSLKNLGTSPSEAYMIENVPVLPPRLRPMYSLPDGTLVSSPINFLYRDAIMVNKELKDGKKLPETVKAKLRKDMYGAVKAIQGLGKPIVVRKEKDLKGALDTIKGPMPKAGYYQSVVFSKKQELTGASTLTASVDMSPDEILMPKKMAWNIYEPFAMKELISMGYKARDAAKMVANKEGKAEVALEKAVSKRPVWVNRAPSLHKFNILAVQPKLYDGDAVKMHPLVFGGMNADSDGDCIIDSVFAIVDRAKIKTLTFDLTSGSIDVEAFIQQRSVDMPSISQLPIAKGKQIIHLNLEDFPILPETKVEKKDGVIEYAVPDGIEIFTLDPTMHTIVRAPVTKFSIHPDLQNYVVKTSTNDTLWLSSDHSAITYDSKTGELVKTKPQALAGKAIPKINHLKVVPSVFDIPLIDYTAGTATKYKPVTTRKVDQSLGHFIGMMVGDGWVSSKNAVTRAPDSICFANVSAELADAFHNGVLSLLKNEAVSVYKKENPHLFQGMKSYSEKHTVSSLALAQNIKDWIGHGAHNKHLPPFYMAAPEEFRIGLLSGLLDTDGSVAWSNTKSKPQMSIKYSTVSERLAQEIVTLAKTLGVRANLKVGAKEFTIIFSSIDMHKIKLCLKHPKRAKAFAEFTAEPLSEATLKTQAAKYDLIPFHEHMFKHYMKALPKGAVKKGKDKTQNSLYITMRRALKTGCISKRSMRKIREYVIAAGLPFPGFVDQLLEDTSVTWVYASKVTKSRKPVTMYDITAPGPYTFMVTSGIIVQDTVSIHTPVTQAAVEEARQFTPTKVLESPRDYSIMTAPSMDLQLGLFVLTAKGRGKAGSYSSVEDAKKAFYANKLNISDVVTIAGRKTTLGRELVKDVLPNDIIIPEGGVTKKNIGDFMKDLAGKHRADMNDIMYQLSKLASEYNYQAGISLTLNDLKRDTKVTKPLLDEIKAKFPKLKTRKAKTEFLIKMNEKLDKVNSKWTKDNVWDNNLALTATASGKPNSSSMKQLKFMPLVLKDVDGRPVPVPITRSYANGLTVSDYWAASYGSRTGMIDRALQTSEPGYFAKQLLSVVDNQVISMDDCGTDDGIVLDPKVESENDFLYRYKVGSNTLIDSVEYKRLKASGRPVKVRSPITCEAAEGVCAKCFGNKENGQKAQIGDNVGMSSGQSITERGTQLTMKTFHTGAVLDSGSNYSTSGMTRIKQLTNLPQFVSNKAALARIDGKVESVEANPAGGVNIKINGENHFGVVNDPLVKVGDKVKAGQKITSGTVQPKELLDISGIRKTQDHLIEELRAAYKNQGVNVNRRAFETIVRGTTNTTKVLNASETSGYLPGDRAALTKILAWNRKNPTAPIKHKPILLGVDFSAKAGEDWLGKLNTNRLLQVLQEGVARGEKSDIHSYSPVAPYVIGTSFGKGPDGKY